jgi:hypothetical protein
MISKSSKTVHLAMFDIIERIVLVALTLRSYFSGVGIGCTSLEIVFAITRCTIG